MYRQYGDKSLTELEMRMIKHLFKDGWSIDMVRSKAGISHHRWEILRKADNQLQEVISTYKQRKGRLAFLPSLTKEKAAQ